VKKGMNTVLDKFNKAAYKFFVFDLFLNWILGILFIFFFRLMESLIGHSQLLPGYLWIIIGTGLLFFGIWQTYIVIGKKFDKNTRLFSSIMAWACFLLLTYAMVFMNFEIYYIARIVIWIGNLYMFFLGLLYLISYRNLRKMD